MKKFRQALVIAFFTIAFQNAFSQVTEPQDTIKGYNKGKIEMSDPTSIKEAYTYDPKTDKYILNKTFEGLSINYPLILTRAQYEDLVLKESMHKYFKDKMDALDGKKDGAEEKKKDLLPRYYVRSGLFESIFGSNTIDVKPTGSVEVDFGVRHTKQDNPVLSPRNRRTTTFDFNQRISMGLKGKVGTRLSVNANYDTQSTFNFQNLIKLEYAPTEDDIIQKIEVGNVSMPLNSTLIRGAQSLFGVKTQLQFGRTTVTGVFSEQKSQTKTVTSQGGGTVQDFSMFGLEYDSDRHFFLSQYFRNLYDKSLKEYPFINSKVQITRVEVWVTNKQNRVGQNNNNFRNVIALQDLGEGPITDNISGTPTADNLLYAIDTSLLPNLLNGTAIDTPSDNSNNKYDPALITEGTGLLNTGIREVYTADQGFNAPSGLIIEGTDYGKLENARKLNSNEFTYHPQLGYISLQQRLASDEILAVAYQYTIGDKVYQVGEFGNDGVTATQVDNNGTPSTQALILKMLKSSLTNVEKPIWNLMMKNIYQLQGAYQLQREDFKFNIMYTDPSPLNYITEASTTAPAFSSSVKDTPLLRVFNVDRLNSSNDPQDGGDGFFDFIPGLTIDQTTGRIIFTTVEPFGRYLFEKLRNSATEDYNDINTYNENQTKYVYRSMYRSTQAAALQESQKNKFQLKGKYKSASGDGIPLGAFNVPKGSVRVTAGGRTLVEGVDYTVNYQAGRVQILDPSLQASNTPIEVSVENNSTFGQQTRRFFGVNVEHKFNEKFLAGATFLKLKERPFTQKSDYGQESVNNAIYGAYTNFSTEVPFLTRLANKLPNIDTDVPSNISVRAEVAVLKPGAPQASNFDGVPTVYIDDFEGSQTTLDMRSPLSWFLSSVPVATTGAPYNFGQGLPDVQSGFKRARLNWYTIDPIFYTRRPDDVSPSDLSLNSTRRVYMSELYPDVDVAQGNSQVVNTLDLTYYPQERGPYNYNTATLPDNTIPNPQDNFGGIMRGLTTTNFEQSNVEYIQFWLLDPYMGAGGSTPSNVGKLYFNLGEISEDILKDGRKGYENGLGANQQTIPTDFAKVPASQSLIYAFDTDENNRATQDVGLNGLNNGEEAAKYPAFASFDDPSQDDYTYYLNTDGGVLERYKKYNGTEGNSPTQVTDTNRGNTTIPDVEDVNRDYTMTTINGYYEYSIDLKPGVAIGDNYVTDIRDASPITLADGSTTSARWIQYKIPISIPERTVGAISDFRSIRFMRMFMTGLTDQITVRLGSLDLVRGEWRRYTNSLDYVNGNPDPNEDDGTEFDVFTLNVQENGRRSPINYVSPPGVFREQLYNNNTVIRQNEQSLGLRVRAQGDTPTGLQAGDSRAVFKNVSVDMRQYKRLKMFLHAEALPNDAIPFADDEMVAFIRFGNDFTDNFYQIEIPLKKTAFGATSDTQVWPEENEIDVALSALTQLKIQNMSHVYSPGEIVFANEEDLDPSALNKNNKAIIGIRGNPNFGLVRTLMVGIKNRTNQAPFTSKYIRGEVWFNELRIAEMDTKGGMAALVNVDGNIADFATMTAMGKMSTIGFGSLEQKANERSREDIKQYNVVTNLSLGKLLPKDWKINLPFNYGIGEDFITPKYDPYTQDIELKQMMDLAASDAERQNIKNRAIDYTKRRSINFIGVRKDRGESQKPRLYDIENITLSQSYNEVTKHNYEVENYLDQQSNTRADYTYSFEGAKPIEPFKNTKTFKKSDYWKLLRDFNFNYLPSNISFSANILRQFNQQQYRLVDVEGIGLERLYKRNFLFNYNYGFTYNLSKSLKVNFNANSNNVVINYLDENNKADNSYTLWTDYWNPGIPNQHNQTTTVNYDIPLNKIPFLSFVKPTYVYTGTYSWQRASLAYQSILGDDGLRYNLGNTIQNSASHKLTTQFNMDALYKYIGLTKTNKPKPAPQAAPKPGEKVKQAPTNTNTSDVSGFKKTLIGLATSIKNITVNYSQNEGTVLPGYLPGIGFFGTAKPTLGFPFGFQDDVRYEAAKMGWLTTYPNFNQNYTRMAEKKLDYTANVELFPDFKVDIIGNRSHIENASEQFQVVNGQYNAQSPYTMGSFSITTVMLKTAFKSSDEFSSTPFDDFRNNRIIIAERLAEKYYGNTSYTRDADGYPSGFGRNSQRVLLPAFLSAYTGLGILNSGQGETAKKTGLGIFRDFPIPNWTIKYTGLMRLASFKEKFKRFSIQHAYKASYTLNAFRSNLDVNADGGIDPSGNFKPEVLVGNVNLVEAFSPLAKVDFETKSSIKIAAEVKKDRALSLSFDNNLLTEVKGIEYVTSFGYRIKDVTISTRLSDTPSGVIKSDLNFKLDFSYRNNKTIVRYLDYDNNQLGGGQNIWQAKLTADYSFSKNLTMIFFYDHNFSKAVISTAFPITNIRTGFTLRYNFGN